MKITEMRCDICNTPLTADTIGYVCINKRFHIIECKECHRHKHPKESRKRSTWTLLHRLVRPHG